KRMEMRITIPEVIKACEEQTGGRIKTSDFYPCTTPTPLSRALSAYFGRPMVEFGNHVHCGMATFIRVEGDGEFYPITHYVDVDRIMETFEKCAEEFQGGWFSKLKGRLRVAMGMLRFFKKKGLMFSLFRRVLTSGNYNALGDFMRSVILIGMMHFQDPYNLDLARVERCVIHYGTPDGRIIPFCTYNTIHRPMVEKQFSIPVEEWRRRRRGVASEETVKTVDAS
ncbi:MAG: tetraether lipid synthase Tes, partial [Candidatus Freyarchaeota archaeon]